MCILLDSIKQRINTGLSVQYVYSRRFFEIEIEVSHEVIMCFKYIRFGDLYAQITIEMIEKPYDFEVTLF